MKAVTVRAFAKINLTLEVLNRRPDGYHNLRTVFQTISLHDTIGIEADVSSGESSVELKSDVNIPGENLIIRAARAILDATGVKARVSFELHKRIPMGGGLGGGSTDAAAVLLALPALLRAPLPLECLLDLGAALGSDVPFFIVGGTALGIGRGTELYPLPDADPRLGLLLAPAIHVSTADAYRGLQRTEALPPDALMNASQRVAIALRSGADWTSACVNHFEDSVFAAHPELARVRSELAASGPEIARMTGSGAAIFGLFRTAEQRAEAQSQLGQMITAIPFEFLSARAYQDAWAASCAC